MIIEECLNDVQKSIFAKFKNKIPFRIVEFSNALGIKIFLDDLPDNISGKIEKNDAGDFTIYLNNKHSNTRHIFTIAHELGHYFRHQEYFETHNSIEEPLYNTFQKDRLDDNTEQKTREREANEFAAELLMPSGTIKEKWTEFHFSITKMAKYFNVSEIAIAFRIKNTVGADYTNEYLIV
ncbi:MAG: Zn-dependent peptidase ImmA (M78 family) [Candidatus Deianiraeaceae bacterium]|jgi:Zn-dependent peptidase ImmA (M78 family)